MLVKIFRRSSKMLCPRYFELSNLLMPSISPMLYLSFLSVRKNVFFLFSIRPKCSFNFCVKEAIHL